MRTNVRLGLRGVLLAVVLAVPPAAEEPAAEEPAAEEVRLLYVGSTEGSVWRGVGALSS